MATNTFKYYGAVIITVENPDQRRIFVASDSFQNATSVLEDYVANTLAETGLVICELVDSKSEVIVNDETP